MADPEQKFVVSFFTRKDLAADLNNELEIRGCKREIADDDDRLTDVLCQNYAEVIGNLNDDMPEELVEDNIATISLEILAAMGIEIPDDEN